MQKHIERIDNLSCSDADNLTVEKLGHFNLFSGKTENGYSCIVFKLRWLYNKNKNVVCEEDFLYLHHYSDLKEMIRKWFKSIKNDNIQIFATTQRLDVIQAFAEVAQEYQDIEAYYYRLGRSERDSNKGQSIVTMYEADRLLELTKQNIEVR